MEGKIVGVFMYICVYIKFCFSTFGDCRHLTHYIEGARGDFLQAQWKIGPHISYVMCISNVLVLMQVECLSSPESLSCFSSEFWSLAVCEWY